MSRKRRRVSTPPAELSKEAINSLSVPDDEPTDFKLALLSSMHPTIDQTVLLDILLVHDGSVEAATASLLQHDSPPKTQLTASLGYQSSLSNFVGEGESSVKRAKVLSKKGKTLHLYSPEDVAAHTPCSIIHNFLPVEEANSLLKELLLEAPTFESMTFRLFDNVVQSPHTACFYVESYEEMQRQKTEYVISYV